MTGQGERTIALKTIIYKAGRRRNFSPQAIHDVLNQAWQDAANVEQLVYPTGNNLPPGHRRCFMVDGKRHGHGFSSIYGARFFNEER